MRWITTLYDWRVAMIVLGDLAWLITIPLALLIKNAPADMGAVALGGAAAPHRDFATAQVLRAPQFWAIALTHFACCAAHAGPIFHMVTHAIDQGVTPMIAATVLGVSRLSSIPAAASRAASSPTDSAQADPRGGPGRPGRGGLHRISSRATPGFYTAAVLAGLSYGSVVPLYALVTREYFGEKVMGTAYGAVFLISTLGMGLGSWAGGWIHDAFGTCRGSSSARRRSVSPADPGSHVSGAAPGDSVEAFRSRRRTIAPASRGRSWRLTPPPDGTNSSLFPEVRPRR